MALTNAERERIREEEWVRLQAREDFSRSRQKELWREPRIIAIAVAIAVVALLLFSLVRSNAPNTARLLSSASYSLQQ